MHNAAILPACSDAARSSRARKNILWTWATRGALGLCIVTLAFLLFSIIFQGFKALSLNFLFTEARNFGADGGILYQILGSILIVVTSALLVLPFAIGTAVYRNEYLSQRKSRMRFDLILFGLNGIPSIAYGLFGLIVFVNVLGTGLSWFVGSIILAIMMFPTVTLTTINTMRSIPNSYREAGLALGLSQSDIIRRIILPQSLHGMITGLMLGLARIIGETAPIMFIATAFSGVTVPSSLNEPVATLPTHILALAQQATNPDALRAAWGASLVLVLLVLIFSALAVLTRLKFQPLSER